MEFHEEHRRIVRELLFYAALKKGKGISYQALATQIGKPNILKRPDGREKFASWLGDISHECHALGLPLLSGLVYREQTGIPGPGFYNLFSTYPPYCEKMYTQTEFIKYVLDLVYACDDWGQLEYAIGLQKNLDRNVNKGLFKEGAIRIRMAKERERDSQLVKETRKACTDLYGELLCEVCKTSQSDFEKTYPCTGEALFDVHHRIPHSFFNEEHDMRVEDMSVVCVLCHRAAHQLPDLSFEEFCDKYNEL